MLAAALMLALSLLWAAPVDAAKPAVPAGRDPGGIAVALIGDGIDYRDGEIARRLARDGEGDLIGRDVIDGDSRPFAAATSVSGIADSTAVARAIASAPGRLRLIPIRAASDDVAGLARAIAFAATTPARVALLPLDGLNGPRGELVRQAAQRFPGLLLVVVLAELDTGARLRSSPMRATADTLIVAVAAAADRPEPELAEVAIEVGAPAPAGGQPLALTSEQRRTRAAAGLLLTAACIAAAAPTLTAREIKREIDRLADRQGATGGRGLIRPACPPAPVPSPR
jgi:hypothetical protein